MIPGIGISTFVPKIRNYADIGLVYKRTSLNNTTSSNSSTFIPGYTSGQVVIFFVESDASTPAISSTGFVQIGKITGYGTTLTIFYWLCDGAPHQISFQTIVGHITSYYAVYSNVDTTNPINVYAISKQDALTTSLNAPAVTTSRNKCLVINATGVMNGNFMGNGASAWANSYLSTLAELCDYAPPVKAGILVATGFMVTAGNTGLTTFTYGTSTTATSITLALNPKEI